MNKYIIIVHVYDEENSQAYPLGGVFRSHEAAEEYIKDHWEKVKSDHWANGYEVGDSENYYYEEGFTALGDWVATDRMDGASLEITIHTVEEML